jgi:redox-sensitive bicupin YhaK (pirin superfamily)
MPALRDVRMVVSAQHAVEGGGFRVRRPFPTRALDHLDPFLLLDEMGPADHAPGEAKGAPDHPHRGFETVTLLLAGEMEHRDSRGNAGSLGPGDVQWMTAGDGVVHSEMPSRRLQAEGGRVHGFQLWVNLPAREKRVPPRYQDLRAAAIPRAATPDGKGRVRVIAGEALGLSAPTRTHTPILALEVDLDPGGVLETAVPAGWNAAFYLFSGDGRTGPAARAVRSGDLAVLGAEGAVRLEAGDGGTRALLLAGAPIGEPVARYGPFVMNTERELYEAVEDFRAGRMGAIPAEVARD